MAVGTDNTDNSVIYFPGEVGHHPGGATASAPESRFNVATATAAPTEEPTGNQVVFYSDDLYYWDGEDWLGPYVLGT